MTEPLPKIFPPIIALLHAGAMWLLANYFPLANLLETPWNRIGYVVMVIAGIIDFWSLGLFARAKTTFHPLKLHDVTTLVTSGMYRVTRNPMYLGLLLLLSGWAIVLGKVSPFVMLPIFIVVMNHQQIRHEERILEEKFGDQYRDYKARVRRWI